MDDISIKLPVRPWNDLFEKMSHNYKSDFKKKLESLRDTLKEILDAPIDPHENAKKLQKVFGDDFPVPEKKDTAVKTSKPIISSSHSA